MDEKIEPKPKKRTGWIPRTIWTIVALFFVLLFFDWVILEALSRLFVGWLALLRVNVTEIAIVPHRVASALIMASLAVAGLHFLALRWRGWARPGGTPWRWIWSLSISAILLSAALAAMAVAGAAHQIAWLKGEPFSESRTSHVRKFNDAKQLTLIALDHAEKDGGRFPDDLIKLIEAEFGRQDEPWLVNFLLYQENTHTTPEPWLYYGSGRSRQDEKSFLLLAAPRSSKGFRIAAMSNGQVKNITEEEFTTLLATLPPLSSASTLSR
jgi:hypothetical protein